MKSFKDWQGRRKKKPGRTVAATDSMYPHKDIAQVYEHLQSYKEFKNEQDLVQVDGYGKVTRRQAKEMCIEKMQNIASKLQFGEEVNYNDFELAKSFFVAFKS